MKPAKKQMPKSISGKRILLPLARIDFDATQGRVLGLVSRLANAGAYLDVMSHHEDTIATARQRLADIANVRVLHNPSQQVFWTPQRRDDIVRAFIKDNADLCIPGTGIPYWKTAAFDDFRGHVSAHTFDELERNYDLILVPMPSIDESPALEADVLVSNCFFHAKEHGIPVAGLQIYPALQAPRLNMRLLDYLIVRSGQEAAVYRRAGVAEDKLRVLSDAKDVYCLTPVEDVYLNLLFDERIKIEKNELFIVIMNHSRYRAQIIEVIKAIGKLPFPAVVCFVKVLFEVRDLHEDQIYEELIRPHLDKLGKYYVGEIAGIGKLSMLCDVEIAATYVTPLSFAARYGKGAVVYNPIRAHAGREDEVEFITREDELRAYLHREYERKQQRSNIVDIVTGIMQ